MWGAQSSSPVSSVSQTRFRENLGEKGESLETVLKEFGFNHNGWRPILLLEYKYSESKGFVSGFFKTIYGILSMALTGYILKNYQQV